MTQLLIKPPPQTRKIMATASNPTMSFSLYPVIAEALENTITYPSGKIKSVYTPSGHEIFGQHLLKNRLLAKTRLFLRKIKPEPMSDTSSRQCFLQCTGKRGCSGCTPAEPYPPGCIANLQHLAHHQPGSKTDVGPDLIAFTQLGTEMLEKSRCAQMAGFEQAQTPKNQLKRGFLP